MQATNLDSSLELNLLNMVNVEATRCVIKQRVHSPDEKFSSSLIVQNGGPTAF